MPSFIQSIGIAVIILAVAAPLTYCVEQDENRMQALELACLTAKGDWTNAWGGRCTFPRSDAK